MNGPPDPKEYARVYDSDIKKTVKAHRYFFRKAHGPIPRGMVVMHTCDNRKCVRLSHLKLGTQGDNLKDMYEKNRQGERNLPKGSLHHATKITDAQARNIRSLVDMPVSSRALGRQYGVSRNTIENIWSGKTWSHLSI